MGDAWGIKLLSVYILVAVGLAVVIALAGLVVGGTPGTPDGASVEGQSPSQFQPDALDIAVDPETGEIPVDGSGGRVLVDTEHANRLTRSELEPLEEALFRAGHTLSFGEDISSTQAYNETLAGTNGLLVIQPTDGFSPDERSVLRNYTDAGGHVVVLAEPTQTRVSIGLLGGSTTVVSFDANNLTGEYGVRMGAESLFNIDDSANDNNFKSIYAAPRGDGPLTDGVETVTFDTAGYAVVRPDSDAEVIYAAAEGTQTLGSRRTAQYPTVARTENFVFVADTSFVDRGELYDADNEVFVGRLLSFLATGTAPERVPGPPAEPSSADNEADDATDTPTPEPTPGNETTPTPSPMPSG
ncbi:DUF4350 domain-containing protein [Haloarcula marina]|uniref:DUF4350 domain-containing protein n=1 Tax=Haloarcula marina TaxID=2961574 RepID=UPI0020B8FF7C|nr:DUF4350 domain-containing protein [Halomicroarcula marina]